MVTAHPGTSNVLSNSGMAVVSLDRPSTLGLTENQTIGRRPRTHHVECRLVRGSVVRALKRLAVYGHDLTSRYLIDRFDPFLEALLELNRSQVSQRFYRRCRATGFLWAARAVD